MVQGVIRSTAIVRGVIHTFFQREIGDGKITGKNGEKKTDGKKKDEKKRMEKIEKKSGQKKRKKGG